MKSGDRNNRNKVDIPHLVVISCSKLISSISSLFSALASVVVNVENLNDESPVFESPQGYSVSIPENSPVGTEIIQVKATDKDEG